MTANGSRVRLNIGGTTFLTYDETLAQFPESKLANLSRCMDNYDDYTREYFFDRNPVLFGFILDAYRKEEIHLPGDICGPTFRKELEFWELSLSHVAPCCWEALYKSDDDVKTVNKLMDNYKKNASIRLTLDNHCSYRKRLWLFLDDPKSSYFAMAWVTFISLLVIVSTVAEMLITIPELGEEYTKSEKQAIDLILAEYNLDNRTTERVYSMKPNPYLTLTITCCHVILTFEFILTFIVCPTKKAYMFSVVRVAVFLGYILFWASFTIESNFSTMRKKEMVLVYLLCKYGTILKLARLFYLSKHIPALNIVGVTFSASISEFKILVFLLGILVCIFGYMMYATEFLDNDAMTSTFVAMYWALITLTTVGYGDMVPYTVAGHVVTSVCAVCGVIVLAMPIGIIASTFNKYYNFNSYVLTHVHLNSEVLKPIAENGDARSSRKAIKVDDRY
ncbi:hypothetical protein ACF0H5_001688 [Mactra antiquata]